MQPAHELLRLPAEDHGDHGLLRRLARGHAPARQAAHVSRSYCADYALVAWHAAPVGVDLERVHDADLAFAESICTPAEILSFGSRLEDPRFVTSLWSSKEALAKALGDAIAYDPRRLESPVGWLDDRAGVWRARELTPAPDHVAWLVWSAGALSSTCRGSARAAEGEAQKRLASAERADSTRLLAGRR